MRHILALLLLLAPSLARAFPDGGGYTYPPWKLTPTCTTLLGVVCDGIRFTSVLTQINDAAGDVFVWPGLTGFTGSLAQTGWESPGAGAAPIIWWENFCSGCGGNLKTVYTVGDGAGTAAWGDVATSTVLCTANCTHNGSQTFQYSFFDVTQNWTATHTDTRASNAMDYVEAVVELASAGGVHNTWTGPIRICCVQVHYSGAWHSINFNALGNPSLFTTHSGSSPSFAIGYPSTAFGPTGSDFSLCSLVSSSSGPSNTQACGYTGATVPTGSLLVGP